MVLSSFASVFVWASLQVKAMNSLENTTPQIGRACDVVRIFIGGILLVAASLKGYQVTTEPTAEISLLTSRWFLVLAVEFELLLGVCLAFGIQVRMAWLVTVASFAVFASISLYKALLGEVSCGCFGSVQINPWHTFCLDMAVLGALVRYRPTLWRREASLNARRLCQHVVVLGAWLMVAALAGWGMLRFEANTLDADGTFLSDGEIVVLEPETWPGKSFPLSAHIDIGEELASGSWLVVLYHHECPQCQSLLPSYDSIDRSRGAELFTSVVLVEVPPFGPKGTDGSSGSSVRRARLRETKRWFVETPTEIQMIDGIVTTVRGAKELEEESRKGERRDAVPLERVGAVVRQVHYEEGREP